MFFQKLTIPCKLCGELLGRELGPAVLHMWQCNAIPSCEKPPLSHLMKDNDADQLRRVHEFCMRFAVLETSDEHAVREDAASQNAEDAADQDTPASA